MKELIYSLQLFASGVSGGPTAGSNSLNINRTSDLSTEMKTYYDTELLENVRANLVYNQFGRNQGLPKGNGKSVEWRRFASYGKATTPLVEGVTPAGETISVTPITAEVKQYGDYTAITDFLDLTAVDDTILAVTDEHAAQAAATLDTLTRDELMKGTNVYYAPTVSSGTETPVTSRYALGTTSKMTASVVNHVVTLLKKNNAPRINGKYIAIIHPSVAEDLRRDPAWNDVHKYAAPEEIFNGEIGELHGCRFIESTEAKIIKTLGTVKANTSSSTSVTMDGNIGTGSSLTLGAHFGTTAATVSAIANNGSTTAPVTTFTLSAAKSLTAGDKITLDNAVYCTLFLGQGAYGTVDLDGAGLEMIVKALGSGGTADPLNQRQTVGWKAGHAAAILDNGRMVRVESLSGYSATDEDN